MDGWRLEMRLKSRAVLIQYMTYRRQGVRTLAALCDPARPGRHRSAIGHLRSGKRSTCGPELARRIEEVLEVPAGVLFEPKVSSVRQDTRTKAGAA